MVAPLRYIRGSRHRIYSSQVATLNKGVIITYLLPSSRVIKTTKKIRVQQKIKQRSKAIECTPWVIMALEQQSPRFFTLQNFKVSFCILGIGNGWMSPLEQGKYASYLYYHGLLDGDQYLTLLNLEEDLTQKVCKFKVQILYYICLK